MAHIFYPIRSQENLEADCSKKGKTTDLDFCYRKSLTFHKLRFEANRTSRIFFGRSIPSTNEPTKNTFAKKLNTKAYISCAKCAILGY